MTLFGPLLQALKLEHIESFLRDADAEPLLWEAKGTEINKGSVRKAICGFANGRETAYLILGAEETGDNKWHLPGVALPDEPPVWVANVIQDHLRPRPDIDVRPIQISGDRHVSVVAVPPVAVPPCITNGIVYERVSGKTIPVKEPTRLSELYRRGEAARQFAEEAAGGAADALLEDPALPLYQRHGPRVSVAVSATGHPPDISSRLFSQAFEKELGAAADECLITAGAPGPFEPTVSMGIEQSNRSITVSDHHGRVRPIHWHARAIWNGTVVIYGAWEIENLLAEHVTEELIRPAWNAASRLVGKLGGYGPRYAQIRVLGGKALQTRKPTPRIIAMGRGPSTAAPAPEEIESIDRELHRAVGETVYEVPVDRAGTQRGTPDAGTA